jgi:hypothetical protein
MSRRPRQESAQPPSRDAETQAPKISAVAIIERMKNEYGVKTDAELANRLEVSTPTIASWRRRNSVPFEQCVRAAVDCRTSLDSLVLGRHTPTPGILEGDIDPDILGLAVLDELTAAREHSSDLWERARLSGRVLALHYARFAALLDQSSKAGMSREDFLKALRKSLLETAAVKATPRRR